MGQTLPLIFLIGAVSAFTPKIVSPTSSATPRTFQQQQLDFSPSSCYSAESLVSMPTMFRQLAKSGRSAMIYKRAICSEVSATALWSQKPSLSFYGRTRSSSSALREQSRSENGEREYYVYDSWLDGDGSGPGRIAPEDAEIFEFDPSAFAVDPYDDTIIEKPERPSLQEMQAKDSPGQNPYRGGRVARTIPKEEQNTKTEHAKLLSKEDYASISEQIPKQQPAKFPFRRTRYSKTSEVVDKPSIPSSSYEIPSFKYSKMPLPKEIEHLAGELERLELEIHQLSQSDFNVNSPRQVSIALFGEAGQPTNKNVLEGIASQTPLAKLILEYRTVKARHSRLEKKLANQTKGVHVRDVHSKSVAVATDEQASDGDDDNDSDDESPSMPKRSTVSVPADPLLIVDTSAYIFRAYFSMPPMHRSDGLPVGAVLGFCNMINRIVLPRLLDGDSPRIILAMDAPGDTFRHEMYKEYKANRPSPPVDLIPQFDLIREAADAYGLTMIEKKNYEADDVIATLARLASEAGFDVNILSGDKDLMQLVTRDDVTEDAPAVGQIQMIDPMSMVRIDHAAVVEKWGVPADRLGDVLALAGDKVDNVPGVPGIGPKIAATLIDEFGSLGELLDRLEEIPQKARRAKLEANVEQARLSRRLVELDRNVDITLPEELRMESLDLERVLSFYDRMGFVTIRQRLVDRFEKSKIRETAIVPSGDDSKMKKKKTRLVRAKATIPKPEDFDVPF